MNYRITASPSFLRELKRLYKRYKSIKQDIEHLVQDLKQNPNIGVDLGNGLRKIRVAITAKGKGKSGGARVITYNIFITEIDAEIKLLYIYDKSDKEAISENELHELMKKNGLL